MSSTRRKSEADSINGLLTRINDKIWRFIENKLLEVYFKKESIKEDIDNLIQNTSITDAEFGVEIRNYLNELYLAHLFLFRLVGQYLPDNIKLPASIAKAFILSRSVIKLDCRFSARINNRHMDTVEFTNSREHFYLQSLVLKFFILDDLADELTRIFSIDADGKLVNPNLEQLIRFLQVPNLALEKTQQYNSEVGNIILLMNTKSNKEVNCVTSAAIFYRDFYFDNNMVSFISKHHFDYLIKLEVTSETLTDEICKSAKEVFEAILLSEIYILEFFRYSHQGFMVGNDIPMPELAPEIASRLKVKPEYALLGQNDITEGNTPSLKIMDEEKKALARNETPEMKEQFKTIKTYIDFARLRKAVRHIEDDLDLRPAIKAVVRTMKASINGIHCVNYILECIDKRQHPSLAAILMNQNNRALAILGNIGAKPLTPAPSPTAASQAKKISRPNTPKLATASSPVQSPKKTAAPVKTSSATETNTSDYKEHFSKNAYLHLYSTMKTKHANLDAKEKEYAALHSTVKNKLANCKNRKKHIEQAEQINNNFKEKMHPQIKALRAQILGVTDVRSSDKAHTDLQELSDKLTQTLRDFETYYIDRLLAIHNTLTITATVPVPEKNSIQLEKERKAEERLKAIAAKKEKKAAAKLRSQIEMESGMTNIRRTSEESKSPESTSRTLSDGSPILDWEDYVVSPNLNAQPGILMVPPMMRRSTSASSGESLDLTKLISRSSSVEEIGDSVKVSVSPLILADKNQEVLVNIERIISPGVEEEMLSSPETTSTPEPQEVSRNDIRREKSPDLVKVSINPLVLADNNLEIVVNIESLTSPGVEKEVSSSPEAASTPEPQEVSDNEIIEEKSSDLVKVSINPSTDNNASLPVIVSIESLLAGGSPAATSDTVSTSDSKTESPEEVTVAVTSLPSAADERPEAVISRRENFTLTLSSLNVQEDDDQSPIKIIPDNVTVSRAALSSSSIVIATATSTTFVAKAPTTFAETAPGTLAATAPATVTETPAPVTTPVNPGLSFDEQVQLFLLFKPRKRNPYREEILIHPPYCQPAYATVSPSVLNGYPKPCEGTAVDKVIRAPFFLSRHNHEIQRAFRQARQQATQQSESFNRAVERLYNSKRRPPGI